MSLPDSFATRSLILPNGLRVSLCSAPRLKRCAAAIRVAAGSHDVSGQWPGLAHFLEHLFFLGTERFAADQNLMTFVQRHGGQLNASTLERTTDFFFELPPAVFADGLERLCEMLAHPRMTIADQMREREVLHAEFIAWSRDTAAQEQLARLDGISPRHPLRGFHAGNRFSLPVPRPAFQQALQDFYQQFYRAGQMTLSLTGPQSLDELEALAQAHGAVFLQGSRVEQAKPPALVNNEPVDHFTRPLVENEPRRIHLLFACEHLPQGHERAADFLCTWLNNEQAGGLIAELRERALADSLKAAVIYQFEGQVLFEIEFVREKITASQLSPTEEAHHLVGVGMLAMTPDPTHQIHALTFNWLAFFKAHFSELLDEYSLLEQRKLEVGSAMALARYYSANLGQHDLVIAVSALLDQLTPAALVMPTKPGEVICDSRWRLPRPNPFLRPATAPLSQDTAASSLIFSPALPDQGESTIYLRWTLPSPQPKLAKILADSLKALIADAHQAGVAVVFSSYGSHWQLKLTGLTGPLPAVMEHALQLLSQPDERTLARYGQSAEESALMPIRQLIKMLPDHFLNSASAAQTNDLQRIWEQARWCGFATGFDSARQSAVAHAARLIPANPQNKSEAYRAEIDGRRWHVEPSNSSEDAILMFYPLPSSSIKDEARGRLLAQMIQAPFYQRLRVDLQLGYAVFSGFRQIDGRSGLLFGVQSPSVPAQQLVDHIENFLRAWAERVEQIDLSALISAQQDQMRLSNMDSSQAAELLWQAHLAGHGDDYPARLQHSLAHLTTADLLRELARITLAHAPRLCLSNRPEPCPAGRSLPDL